LYGKERARKSRKIRQLPKTRRDQKEITVPAKRRDRNKNKLDIYKK
jgi:hypothetical protein